MAGIIDWRANICARLGVEMRFNSDAEASDVAATSPDVVIIATGGLPNTDVVPGAEHAVSGWDILSGDVTPAERVLLFDDNAAHHGLTAAEAIIDAGSDLEIVTPERFFAADVGGLNHAAYARILDRSGTRLTISKRLKTIRRDGNTLIATIGSDYSDRIEERQIDQVVIEHGILPLDDLYRDLRPASRNHGEVDYRALIGGREQAVVRNPDGRYRLFRIGDAVAGRNIHAAVYDALRLCMAL
jgi:NADPH-dependent 2,4-dienoyl-CoA reductase/sulfur reductase-like enzyme